VVVAWAAPVSSARAQDERAVGGPAQAAKAAPAPADPARMKRLLQLWAGQSSKLKSLDVTISRVDEAPAWGNADRFEGRALFLSPNLAWLDFKRVGTNAQKQKVLTHHERI